MKQRDDELARLIEKQCQQCWRHDDGYCLRLDHPDFDYDWRRIRKGHICPERYPEHPRARLRLAKLKHEARGEQPCKKIEQR
jgi:hypothetical protein